MECTECNATGYGLHHSAACKYLNVDIYAEADKLQKAIDKIKIFAEQDNDGDNVPAILNIIEVEAER